MPGLRCRHAFEAASIHANGEVVCSIIDGRGDFVIGNINDQPLPAILAGERARLLRQLVLSTPGATAVRGSSCGMRCGAASSTRPTR